MFNKIYLAVFIVALLIMSILTFLAFNQLQSIGFPPPQIVQNFETYDQIHKTALWISSLILLILANVILWTYRKSWALWLTFGFFAVFILLNSWWLGETLVAFKKANNLMDGGFSVSGLIGAILCVVIGIGIFFNQFIVSRMHDKMYPKNNVEVLPEKTETVLEETNSNVNES